MISSVYGSLVTPRYLPYPYHFILNEQHPIQMRFYALELCARSAAKEGYVTDRITFQVKVQSGAIVLREGQYFLQRTNQPMVTKVLVPYIRPQNEYPGDKKQVFEVHLNHALAILNNQEIFKFLDGFTRPYLARYFDHFPGLLHYYPEPLNWVQEATNRQVYETRNKRFSFLNAIDKYRSSLIDDDTHQGDSEDEALRTPRNHAVGPNFRNYIVHLIRGFPQRRRRSAPMRRRRRG